MGQPQPSPQPQAQSQPIPQTQQQKQQPSQSEEGPRPVNDGHRNVNSQQYMMSARIPVLQKQTAPVSARASWPHNRKSAAAHASAVLVQSRSPRPADPDGKAPVSVVTPRPNGMPLKAP